MTNTDWADEAASEIWRNIYPGDGNPDIAPALRAAFLRGRVAGMREAVDVAESTWENKLNRWSDVVPAIRAAADKLEAGN